MKIKTIIFGAIIAFTAILYADEICSAETSDVTIDLRSEIVASSAKLSYNSSWIGNNSDAIVVITDNDTEIFRGSNEGVFEWIAKSYGKHELTYTTYINGVAQDEVLIATIYNNNPSFIILGARQRYPWNGLVDVKCILEGDGARDYKVTLAVKDEMGGTNLPARTFWQNGGTVTNSVQIVRPGNLHFVWDANADIAEDGFECDRVSVKVQVEPLNILSKPTNVREHTRQPVDCVDLIWDPVPGATAYEIWQSNEARGDITDSTCILKVSEPSFFEDDHTYIIPFHNFWIRAVDDKGNASEFIGPFMTGAYVS